MQAAERGPSIIHSSTRNAIKTAARSQHPPITHSWYSHFRAGVLGLRRSPLA
jgi:hypothetical protein